jgi:hypothetical protein
MSESSSSTQISENKKCTCCHLSKKRQDFCRLRGNDPQYEHATCNFCYERRVKKRQEANSKKKTKTDTSLNTIVPTISTSISGASGFLQVNNILEDYDDIEQTSETSLFFDNDSANIIEIKEHDSSDEDDNDANMLSYCMDEVERFIAIQFQNAEISEEPTKFAFEIELDSGLLDMVEIGQDLETSSLDLEKIKDSFAQLTKVLILPLESGSGYYWKVGRLFLNFKRKEFTGCATAYLECASREDRSQKPSNYEVKRRSEARTAIQRFPCKGKIIINIDTQLQCASIQCEHLCSHERPSYRQIEFPEEAKRWIQENYRYHLRSSELYRYLIENNLILSIHTKEQVYYWASVYGRQTYLTNQGNQLLSSKTYLEWSELIARGFKVLSYFDNDFIRALGFITPLFNRIGVQNINEIVIDSTFKTNQERFELFVVNSNCGGYGMPLAYLYLLTSNNPSAANYYPSDGITTRVQVLLSFFTSLRQEGLLPSFVLLDKDAGEISAVSEAWSCTNLQLCYWHLDNAISKRLKDKKPRSNTYSKEKALEAHQQFDFIDPLWIPTSPIRSLCSEEEAEEIVSIIKRHANMHPLIPVEKNNFWNSAHIYYHCVKEAYFFCSNHKICGLWGYLWINWYNKKDWKIFARSAYSLAMPLARTTMITESHWRVLKYNYKYNYNRPRLDRLTNILVEQLIPDFDLKLAQYNASRSFPSWWQAFKKDWNKAKSADIMPNMDKKYHVDVANWICSCPVYVNSRYLLCKHLIAKKEKDFWPTFSETTRRHDYPFIFFGNNKPPTISQRNNPWRMINMTIIEENSFIENPVIESHYSENSRDISTIVFEKKMEERQEKYSQYEKKFEKALELYKREMDNDNFVKNFDILLRPFIKAVNECEDALQARKQQGTQKSSNEKLAFWLR